MDVTKQFLIPLALVLTLAGCDEGNDGDAGLNSLISQTEIPVLSQDCAFGGVRLESGVDANADGALGAAEVASTDVVCNGSDAPAVDLALRQVISEQSLTGNPAAGRTLPSINDPLAQLGMKLFFSKALGGDQDSACVTCHHPFLGGGDDLGLPVGVAADIHDLLGPGRVHSASGTNFDGGPTVPRNAPTTFNIGLWNQTIFHDGRLENLAANPANNAEGDPIRTPDSAFGVADPANPPNLAAAQARFPVTSPEEMRGFVFEAGNNNDAVRTHLAERLQGDVVPVELATNNWLEEFRTAFADPTGTADALITYDNIALAISEYERSQTFVSNPFRDYIEGNDAAISGNAKLGALMFYGSAGCAGCHSGDFMTDEGFHVVAMPQVGRGKGNGPTGDDDFGRFRETGLDADLYAFRTPSLLNVAQTGPWTHAGAYHSLEAVVRHHGNPRSSVENFDLSQLDPGTQSDNMVANTTLALNQLDTLRAAGTSMLPELTLTEEDVTRMVAFLESLTDPCIEDLQCISQWVPGAGNVDPDDLRVNAVDAIGNPLSP